ncbi:hypothetical protein BV22DRAFT_1013858 [Leucogyrophana mollusca]|uniref:Uncharacterized protein n=1 Tax=Leucogyrophana mollusca TaxID=85980 RepID=A0ACB8BHB7_9AGAM|nr:hypothetical protein BV22DRAFT_1013858 [Leucogyrophana mollusca]
MVEKTLSTGTMNLRFMQNARRAQQLAQVEVEKAHVKDDAEWEVAKDIREAWGLGSGSNTDTQNVTYETSYLPFLFPSLPEPPAGNEAGSSDSRPRGRRTFNKRGEEIIQEVQGFSSDRPETQDTVDRVQPKEAKQIRPKSISGSGTQIVTARQSKRPKDASKEAKRVIYDNSGVGTDLRPPSTLRVQLTGTPTNNTFMKPSGVDGPTGPPQGAKPPTHSTLVGDQMTPGTITPKPKRDRVDGGVNKPQKKTKLTLID